MIPKRLLIHSCTVKRKGETDRDGNVTESTVYNLTACRVDVTRGQIVTEVGYSKSDALTLFYDSVNSISSPAGYEPQLDDRVMWQGAEFTIKNIRTLYTDRSEQLEQEKAYKATYTDGRGDIYASENAELKSAPHHYEAVLV